MVEHDINFRSWFHHFVVTNLEPVVNNLIYPLVIATWTLWALFSHDIRLGFLSEKDDFAVQLVNFIAFIFFCFDLVLNSLCTPGYCEFPSLIFEQDDSFLSKTMKACRFGSYQFWLDMIATTFLLFDVRSTFQKRLL